MRILCQHEVASYRLKVEAWLEDAHVKIPHIILLGKSKIPIAQGLVNHNTQCVVMWLSDNELDNKFVFYHELGHCYAGREPNERAASEFAMQLCPHKPTYEINGLKRGEYLHEIPPDLHPTIRMQNNLALDYSMGIGGNFNE